MIVCADLGVAGNLVRNICLMSPEVHWPFEDNRLNRLIKQYPEYLLQEKSRWLDVEYQNRFWQKEYGVDISDSVPENFSEYYQKYRNVIWLNHSVFYNNSDLLRLSELEKPLFLYTDTIQGLEWQVRAYTEKKTVELLHDFTFPSDKKFEKEKFIELYGHDEYYKLNVTNMKEIFLKRNNNLKLKADNKISLESLILDSPKNVIDQIQNCFDVFIDNDACKLIKAWRNLHWKWDDTFNWKYKT